MSFNMRIPNITATTPTEQIKQVHSYLYQVVEQLNWALNNIDSINAGNNPYVVLNTGATGADGTISQVEASLKSFNNLKGLIIKSADIITAYYEEIRGLLNLSGEFVAEATFPDGSATFIEQTNMRVDATSTNINQIFNNIQTINADLESVAEKLQIIDVTANINSGLLYYDDFGVPIYGLEVGQRTKYNDTEIFNKYARFTANKLSFYDQNDTEVAYISDYKLYITHVEIRGSFKQGGYVDTITAEGGIVTKWVGGD